VITDPAKVPIQGTGLPSQCFWLQWYLLSGSIKLDVDAQASGPLLVTALVFLSQSQPRSLPRHSHHHRRSRGDFPPNTKINKKKERKKTAVKPMCRSVLTFYFQKIFLFLGLFSLFLYFKKETDIKTSVVLKRHTDPEESGFPQIEETS
jgi:hypothetical protein